MRVNQKIKPKIKASDKLKPEHCSPVKDVGKLLLDDDLMKDMSNLRKRMEAKTDVNVMAHNAKVVLQLLQGVVFMYSGSIILKTADVDKALKKKLRLEQDGDVVYLKLVD